MDLDKQKFLVVDDHSFLQRMVEATLKALGASHVDMAANGKDGLAIIQKAADAGTAYHTVFLDWSMPGEVNGYDLLVACRADKKHDDTAIVMLSAESGDTNIVKALNAGATTYIVKPVKPEMIGKKLEDIALWRQNKKGA
ncbi:MAG: response regulator [Alphaproteobacteria bacterium]